MANKKLYKSRKDCKIAGVCGGLGEYFGIDSTWIRLAWVALTLCGGCGILAYIIAMLIIPDQPNDTASFNEPV